MEPLEILTTPATPKTEGDALTINESPSPIEDRDTVVTEQPVNPLSGLKDMTTSGHPEREDVLLTRLITDIVMLKDGHAEPREDDDSDDTRMSRHVLTGCCRIIATSQGEPLTSREGEGELLAQLVSPQVPNRSESTLFRFHWFERAVVNRKPARIKTDPTTKFWTVYGKVADEHDNDLVSTCGGDLDISLLFAGLFSAVTSAFIAQIIPGLQPNPADLTNALLLRILQQDTSFYGTDPLAPVSNIPVGTARARPILFASLYITLFVAFTAVLGKRWILRYARITTWGNIVDRGKERQAKLVGPRRRGLDLIMESLPVMSQFALLLFGIALAIYLWDLDVPTAGVVLVATSLGFAFYACTTVAATIWRSYPFQTPLFALLPKVLLWAKEFTPRTSVWARRKGHGRLANFLGRPLKIFVHGSTPPAPPDRDTPMNDYPMTLCNPAFWRDHPLFTSPIPEDFSEFQWPSHHRSSTPLIRLRDMYIECSRAPKSKESTRLKALQSAVAYYVLYHTQLIWNTWKSLEVEVEKLPSDLPPDLFLYLHNDEWNGDDVFEYLLHIDVGDRSEPVESAQFLSYIAPYWFCGDADPAIRSRPSRLRTLDELIKVLEKSQALTPATITNCVLCAGAAMDFPLHPEDLIRVDKSDYFASTFKLVVEHIHGIALANGPRRRYAKTALETLVTLVKKTSSPLVDAVWISDLLKGAAWGKVDGEAFTVLLRFSAHRKGGDAAMDSGIPSGQDYDHVQRIEADPLSPGGIARPENTLLDLVLGTVKACGAQEDGWQDDAVYGGLVAIRDIPGLRFCPPKAEFLETLSEAMEENRGESKKGGKPLRVRKAAYDVVLAARDGWLRSAGLRETLECLDFPKRLHSVVTETFRSDHQRSFLEMMEILSEDRYWHPYLRREMNIWLPLHREGPAHALRIFTNVGELRRGDFDVDKSLEKALEDEWAAVPGRPPMDLTVDLLEPLAEVTKQFRELSFFTEGGRKGVLGMVERVVPCLEGRLDYGPGDDLRRIVDHLLEALREPMQSSSCRSTYW